MIFGKIATFGGFSWNSPKLPSKNLRNSSHFQPGAEMTENSMIFMIFCKFPVSKFLVKTEIRWVLINFTFFTPRAAYVSVARTRVPVWEGKPGCRLKNHKISFKRNSRFQWNFWCFMICCRICVRYVWAFLIVYVFFSGRYLKSFLEVVRFILTEYEPVSSHGDLKYIKCYDCWRI